MSHALPLSDFGSGRKLLSPEAQNTSKSRTGSVMSFLELELARPIMRRHFTTKPASEAPDHEGSSRYFNGGIPASTVHIGHV